MLLSVCVSVCECDFPPGCELHRLSLRDSEPEALFVVAPHTLGENAKDASAADFTAGEKMRNEPKGCNKYMI